ncbi:MAG: hypothetical protein HY611_08390 [Elusimicrobia bacterium]|nr:hypothetical protein [Elusimicrobiota bacterium]
MEDFFHFKGDYWLAIRSLLGFFSILGFAYGAGKFILRVICADYKSILFGNAYIYVPVIFAPGTFLASLIWLILGSLGFINSTAAYLLSVAGLTFFGYELMRLRFKGRAAEFLREASLLDIFLSCLLIFWIGSWAAPSIFKEFFLDSLVYQLGLPWQYLLDGKIATNPYNIYSYFTQNAEMLFLWPLALKLEPITKLISWFFWICMISTIYGFVREFCGRRFALIAAALFTFWPATFWQASISKGDNAYAFYTLTASLLWTQSWCSKNIADSRKLMLLSGLLIGCAAGTKYSGLISFFHMILLSSIFVFRRDASASEVAKKLSLFALGALIAFSPWMIKSALATGNPVYPYLNKLFATQLVRPWHEGPYPDSGISWGIRGYVLFFKWVIATAGITDFGNTLGPLAVFLIFFCFVPFIRNQFIRLLAILTASGWPFFSLFTLVLRYQIGYLALACALVGAALCFCFKDRKNAQILLVFMLILGLMWKPAKMLYLNNALVAMKMLALNAATETGYNFGDIQELYQCDDFMDKTLPENAKIAVVGENRIFGIPRRFTASSQHDEQLLFDIGKEIKDGELLRQNLVSLGYTHIFLNVPKWNHYLAKKCPEYPAFCSAMEDFVSKHASLLAQTSTKAFRIYKIN